MSKSIHTGAGKDKYEEIMFIQRPGVAFMKQIRSYMGRPRQFRSRSVHTGAGRGNYETNLFIQGPAGAIMKQIRSCRGRLGQL